MAKDKCFTERIMEDLGLDFLKDADKFFEVLEGFAGGGTLG